jgi:hypothetical protein
MDVKFLYIDPGSGSLLFQLLISGIVGAIAFLKIYWKRVKAFFKREKKD